MFWFIYLYIYIYSFIYIQIFPRKFWSQTSDNMDRWKSRYGKSQRGEEKKWEDQRGEKVRRKKMQVREKVQKSRSTVLFPMICGSRGSKSSLKRVRSHVVRWEMKNCTPLWREAHWEVKKQKEPHLRTAFASYDVEKVHAAVARSTFPSQKCQNWRCRTTFGSWDVKKVHAVVAWSTFSSQKCQKLTVSDHFWKLRCRKSACRCGAKHISKWKC